MNSLKQVHLLGIYSKCSIDYKVIEDRNGASSLSSFQFVTHILLEEFFLKKYFLTDFPYAKFYDNTLSIYLSIF